MEYPIYQEALLKNLPKGLYLGLMHGRNSEDETMDDWGFNGPLIGPLKYVHTTYGTHIKMEFVDGFDTKNYEGLFPPLTIYPGSTFIDLGTNKGNEMIILDGKYYGDWSVFYNAEGRDI